MLWQNLILLVSFVTMEKEFGPCSNKGNCAFFIQTFFSFSSSCLSPIAANYINKDEMFLLPNPMSFPAAVMLQRSSWRIAEVWK